VKTPDPAVAVDVTPAVLSAQCEKCPGAEL